MTTMRNARKRPALLPLLTMGALLFVAGCSKKAPEPEPAANESVAITPEPVPVENVPEPETVQETPPPEAKAPPPPEISADAQMEADAAATGMTARIDRSVDTAAAPANGQNGASAP